MAGAGTFDLPDDLLQRAVRAGRGRSQQEVIYRGAAGVYPAPRGRPATRHSHRGRIALLTSRDLDHPERDSAWH